MNKKSTNWFSHPSYFAFVFFLGAGALGLTVCSTTEKTANLGSAELSSEVDLNAEFDQKIKELEVENAKNPFDLDAPYEMTIEQVEEYEKKIEGDIQLENDGNTDSKFAGNDTKAIFQPISADDLSYFVSYEDPKSCGEDRNYIEKTLVGNTKIAEWTTERKQESSYFPRKCMAFALNSYPGVTDKAQAINYKKSKQSSMGRCSSGANSVPDLDKKGSHIKHNVPCVSKNFVNLTYNTYADVSACLNLDPKELFPKLYNESGFFMNSLGAEMDGGIGQLTKLAIDQVNAIYPSYIEQMMKSAEQKPNGACARIMNYRHLLTPVKSDVQQRCSLMWPNENPLRNLVYTGILSKYNSKYVAGISYLAGADMMTVDGNNLIPVTGEPNEELGGHLKDYEIRKKLALLGLKKVNLHQFKSMLVLAGYNSGISTATTALKEYLEERIAANKKLKSNTYNLTFQDFNFESTKDLVKEARNYIKSSFIQTSENRKSKIDKISRRKRLPEVWANAYKKSFPEYMALRMNTYTGGKSSNYRIRGFPGYVTALASKNKMVRDTFESGGINPNYCTSENFLKFK